MPRSLSRAEDSLIRWMLEHGRPDAQAFLPQIEAIVVTDWRCRCGCASITLADAGAPERRGGLDIIADFLFGGETERNGIFLYAKQGRLAGLEVYGLMGEAPKTLPRHDVLRPFVDDRSGRPGWRR